MRGDDRATGAIVEARGGVAGVVHPLAVLAHEVGGAATGEVVDQVGAGAAVEARAGVALVDVGFAEGAWGEFIRDWNGFLRRYLGTS